MSLYCLSHLWITGKHKCVGSEFAKSAKTKKMLNLEGRTRRQSCQVAHVVRNSLVWRGGDSTEAKLRTGLGRITSLCDYLKSRRWTFLETIFKGKRKKKKKLTYSFGFLFIFLQTLLLRSARRDVWCQRLALPFAAVEDPQALTTRGFVTTTEMLLVLRLHRHSRITWWLGEQGL